MRNQPGSSDLYSYYRASALGDSILEHGVEELMRLEYEFEDTYS
jgi:ArsR family transcriptional regulator